MSTSNEEGGAISILSLDSGGPGTYSQLLILKEYMNHLAVDLGVSEAEIYPADYFDLMGGAGFGGFVIVMLGVLRMNVDEAVEALIGVATTIFPGGSQSTNDPVRNSEVLKEAIEGLLQTRGVSVNAKMYEADRPQARCKVAIYAAASSNIRHPHAFRTYSIRGLSLNPTIVDAVCATMAIPSHFAPTMIGLDQRRFVGGPVGTNNPTRELLKEAGTVFGDEKRVSQIISIGCGVPPNLSLEMVTSESGAGRLVKEIPNECQAVAMELDARLVNVDAYLRLSVEKGMGTIEVDNWATLAEIEAHTTSYIQAQEVTWSMEASLRRLKERVGTVTLAQLNQSSSIRTVAKKAPPVSPYFVRREKEWEKLEWHLVTSPSSLRRILVITGMGGCGKTQMVSYFLQEHSSLFKRVAFVDASSSVSIEADLQDWARALGGGHEHDTWEDAIRILACIPENERWVLILDNADNPAVKLHPFLPESNNLTVIITSRNRNMGNLSNTHHMELGEMKVDEALQTLLRGARREPDMSPEELENANVLLKEMGYLAVAIVQAGTYCHELSYTFTQYLRLFRSHRADLMRRAEPSSLDNYQRGAYTTLNLSYKALPQASQDFVRTISFFHHDDIPIAALVTAVHHDFRDPYVYVPRPSSHEGLVDDLRRLLCPDGFWSETKVQEILRTLRSFSLLSISSTNDALFLQLHPLTQAWLRDMDSSIPSYYQSMACQILVACCGDGDFLLHQHLLSHILSILDQYDQHSMHINDVVAIGGMLSGAGQYQTSAKLFETGLKLVETSKLDQETVWAVSTWLAVAYNNGGRWAHAEKLEADILEHRKETLGMEHPETIKAAGNLAITYMKQGHWSEAEKLQGKALEQSKKVLGMEHPETIKAAGNLAITYKELGYLSEAEKLEVEVLEQRKKILGMEHPETTIAAANLATTFQDLGCWSKAEKLQVEVLEQMKKILGVEHPNTIKAAASLASTYHSQGHLTKAEKLQEDVLEQRKKVLGMEHPDTIKAAGNLATTYHSQGYFGKAEKLQMECLEQRRKILGIGHPDTLITAGELAVTYCSQGHWSRAEELQVEVLEQSKRIFGMEHPDTIRTAGNLAITYSQQGHLSEAEKLGLEVLEQRRKFLGMEHPDTTVAVGNLAATYYQQRHWNKAEKLQVEVLEQMKKILGAEHPNTLKAAANLAMTYSQLGNWSEAEELMVEVLEQRKKALGMEHPETIKAAESLAATYCNQGHWSKAEEVQAEVLECRKRTLGMEHPDTIGAAEKLAKMSKKQKKRRLGGQEWKFWKR